MKLKMNKIVDRFFLAEGDFSHKLGLRKPGVTYKAYGQFTKHRERIQKFRETGNLKHLYRSLIRLSLFCS